VIEWCKLALCSYITLQLLLCMTTPWIMTHVPWSVASQLSWSTSAHCRLLVRASAHIVLLASLTSHIIRGRRDSFYSSSLVSPFVFLFFERFARFMNSWGNLKRSNKREIGCLGLEFSLVTRVFSCGGDFRNNDHIYSFTHVYSPLWWDMTKRKECALSLSLSEVFTCILCLS